MGTTCYLVRFPEVGKEPHAVKSKLREDILLCLRAAAVDLRIETDTGRMLVEAEEDITPVLAGLHGISSFSPCVRCTLDELDARVIEIARPILEGKSTFAVKVRRAGRHPFRSQAKAAELGDRIHRALPHLTVDLDRPDETIHVEIRGDACCIYHRVVPGIDREGLRALSLEGPPRFLVDAMLGTLAFRLRALGFDTVCCRDTADSYLLRKAAAEGRVLLTRDRELAHLGGAGAYFVEGTSLEGALPEVIRAFRLTLVEGALFTRCSECNAPLDRVDKELIRSRVPPRVLARHDDFHRCPACDKVYWKGTHYEHLLEELARYRLLPTDDERVHA